MAHNSKPFHRYFSTQKIPIHPLCWGIKVSLEDLWYKISQDKLRYFLALLKSENNPFNISTKKFPLISGFLISLNYNQAESFLDGKEIENGKMIQ